MTWIGLGTAFGLLMMLIAVILIVRLFSTRLLDRPAVDEQPAQVDPMSRDKALAAAIAVTALLASPAHTQSGGDDG